MLADRGAQAVDECAVFPFVEYLEIKKNRAASVARHIVPAPVPPVLPGSSALDAAGLV
jgi:hypothetical protein